MTFDELYYEAKSVINKRELSEFASAGGVGAAILSESGNIYTGVCIDTACSAQAYFRQHLITRSNTVYSAERDGLKNQ